ncbi:MAG: 4-(cytidine 5'-diphospho)-2-C-methyl-D-erythritol kinase, partial [Candidatus Brocadiae bacterium]|nr:4-(cytidine 5'-diphospho)-2-C-methyl-D-erythritol kinase [Candidatus Brocadiia bacterium]
GGGSADAAAALLALDRLWGLALSREALHALAAQLGSDVNFFLEGGTALCTGRGEVVEPVPDPPPMHFVLLTPDFPTLTADVYRAFSFDLTAPRAVARVFLDRLSAGAPDVLESVCGNRLESAALSAEPRLARVLACAQRRAPFGARVTGSGSTVWMPVRDREEGERVVRDGELSAMGRLRVVRSARPAAG